MKNNRKKNALSGKSREQLKMENELLKLKLMAENGANVHISDSTPPEVEHAFLNMIMTIEKTQPRSTTVHSFIGSPLLPDLNLVKSDQHCADEVQKMLALLESNGIDVVFAESLPWKEMLRFLVMDLMQEEMDDIRIPNLRALFFYENFYPASSILTQN